MSRVTVEECLNFVDNRFELVLVAAKRAHQLSSGGYKSTLDVGKDKVKTGFTLLENCWVSLEKSPSG
jgi:DNA-directed RNA polymerase omega subunit